jgi:hypothetical protein
VSTQDPQLEVLLACFDGHKRAGQVRGPLGKKLEANGAKTLDEVVFSVTPTGKAGVYDPRRTWAGLLVPAFTWGLFGLLSSGGSWKSLAVWAVIGGLGGCLFAYYTAHLATKEDLGRLGKKLAPDSSAILTFLVGADASKVSSAAASFGSTPASVATIGGDLSATVTNGADGPSQRDTLLTMLVFRYPGKDTAKRVFTSASGKTSMPPIETELLIDADKSGNLHVTNPAGRAFVKSDAIGWGVLGLVFGAAAGFGGSGGLFGAFEKGIVTAVVWTVFGVFAGFLYGLYAGRAISGGRLKAFGPLAPPDTSVVLAWADGPVTGEALAPWKTTDSQELLLRFNHVSHGAVLET